MGEDKLVGVLAWVGGGIVALLVAVGASPRGDDAGVFVLSLLCLCLGIWVFWTHGGIRITAAGVWGFAFALFVGFSGLYDLGTGQGRSPGLLGALAVAYFGQVLMYALYWCVAPDEAAALRWVADPAVTRWGALVGAALLLASTLVAVAVGYASTLVDALAFASAVLLAASLVLHPGGGLGLWRFLLTACALLTYALFIFSGFGRLTVGALGLAAGILACKRLPRRTVKATMLLVSIPTLLVLAHSRVEFTAGLNPNQLPSVSGFESVIAPLNSFAQLLSRHGQIPLAWGATFWASAVALVPHSLWHGKPEGFGAVLVPILTPDLIGIGQSDAALSQGEWLFNFGLVGLVLMIPALGWSVRRMDRWLQAVSIRPVASRTKLLAVVAATIVVASVPDLLWAGTFTYVARTGARLLVLGLVSVVGRFGVSRLSTRTRTPNAREATLA